MWSIFQKLQAAKQNNLTLWPNILYMTPHATETTLPLITAAATQRRSRRARDGHA